MKTVSLLLILLLLLQSCTIYKNTSTSVEEAVAAGDKVLVITTDRKKYKFKRLEKETNRLIGITKLETSTAKKLAGSPAIIEGKYLKIDLANLNIEEINLRHETGSKVLTIVAIAASLAWVYFVVLASSYDSTDIIPDWLPE